MLSQVARKSSIARAWQVQRATIASAKDVPFQKEYFPFVGGKYVAPNDIEKAQRLELRSPASRDYLTHVVCATEQQTNAAIDLGNEVFENGVWSRADARVRAKVLNNIAEELRKELPNLVPMEVAQTGRAIKEMKAQVRPFRREQYSSSRLSHNVPPRFCTNPQMARLPEWFEYFSALVRTQEGTVPPFLGNYVNYVRRVPLGVCGLLTPWNHPLLIAVKKLAPALATGNSVILKPSELAPVTVLQMGEICKRAGLPDGVLNILPGLGEPVGRAICSHPAMRKIDLTGGTRTGRVVGEMAGRNLCSVLTELGGKAPMLVFDDADVEQAINGAAFATFVASGQTCVMGARLVIHESIYESFMTRLAAKATKIRMGNPFSEDTQMGPVISEASKTRITGMVQDAVQHGAKVYTGAKAPSGLSSPYNEGFFYEPTVLGVTDKMHIWHEEVFGPVVVGLPFKTEEEAIKLANDSPYGLAAAVWSKNIMRAHRVADKLNVRFFYPLVSFDCIS